MLSAMVGASLALGRMGYYVCLLLISCLALGYGLMVWGLRLTSLVLLILAATIDVQDTVWRFSQPIPWLTGARNGFVIQLVDVTIAFLVIAFLTTRKFAPADGRNQRLDHVTVLYVALCVVSLVSLIGARYPELGIYELPIMLKLIIIFFVVKNSVYSMEEALLLLRIFLLVVVLQAGLGIYQSLTGNTLGLEMLGEKRDLSGRAFASIDVYRGVGTLGGSNALSSFLILLIPGALALAAIGRRWPHRVLAGVAFLGGLMSVFLSLGRSGLIVVALMLPLTLLLLQKQSRSHKSHTPIILSVIFALGSLLLIAWPLLVEHLGTLRSSIPSVYLRVGMLDGAFRLFLSRPVLGVGLANSALQMYWEASPSVALPGPITPVHNMTLLWFTETGLVGGVLYLLLLAAIILPLWRRGWRYRDDRSLLIGAFAIGLLGVVAHNQAVWTLRWSLPVQINFWLIAALGFSLSRGQPCQGGAPREEREPAGCKVYQGDAKSWKACVDTLPLPRSGGG